MQDIINYALSLGLTGAQIIPTSIILVQDEVVDRGCAACPSYGKYLSCPPAVSPPEEFRKFLAGFQKALLVQLKDKTAGDPSTGDYGEAFNHLSRMNNALLSLEEFCRTSGFPRARCYIGGHCQLCESCVGPGSPCRNPELLRTSMDANGINVVETCKAAGCPLEFPVKETVTCTGLILLE